MAPHNRMQTRLAVILIALLGLSNCSDQASGSNGSAKTGALPKQAPGLLKVYPRYRTQWIDHTTPAAVNRGKTFSVTVRVRNESGEMWFDRKSANPPRPDGSYATRLSYRWKTVGGNPLTEFEPRIDLPAPVGPGQVGSFQMEVRSPAEPGRYILEFALLEQLIAWFDSRGGSNLEVPVHVE